MKPMKIPALKLDLATNMIIRERTRSKELIFIKQRLFSSRRVGGDRIRVVTLEFHAGIILIDAFASIIDY